MFPTFMLRINTLVLADFKYYFANCLHPQIILKMNAEKLCLCCSKKIAGRTDKKFCNSYCRSTYHNDLLGNKTNYMRQINYLLQKNRRILATVFATTENSKAVPLNELYLKGFSAMHFTHQLKTSKENHVKYCYDYGYKMVGKSHVLIVQDRN